MSNTVKISPTLKYVAKKTQRIFTKSIQISLVSMTCFSCSYPFIANKPREILNNSPAETWIPPKREIKKNQKVPLDFKEYDLNLLEGYVGLGEIIDFSLRNNPSTEYYWYDALEKSALLGVSRADFYPKIDVSGAFSRTRQPYFFSADQLAALYLSTWSATADISYTILDFGTRFANTEAALQTLLAASWAYNQNLQTIIQELSSDYYDYLYQIASEDAFEQDVADAAVSLEAAEKKLQTGVADVSDVLQAKTQLLKYQVDLVNQKLNVKTAFIKLVTDMGLPATTELSVASFPEKLPDGRYLEGVDKFIDMAKTYRPELASSRADVLAKKSLVEKAQRAQWPVVTGDFNVQGNDYSNRYPDTYQYAATVTVQYPVFAGFWYRNRIREAKAIYKKALASLKSTEETILQQVTTTYNDYYYALERIKYTQAYLDAAQLDFEVNLASYKTGTVDILDVLTAQTALANARSRQVEAVKQLFVSLTNLAFASGSLINPLNTNHENQPYNFEMKDLQDE